MLNKIFIGFLHLISHIPPRVAYLISDILYLFQKHIIKYRKDIVFKNLKNSFPTLPEDIICKYYDDFNKHFCDYTMESIMLPGLSKSYIDKHVTFENLELLKDIYGKNQNVVLLCGHIFNWEFTIELAKYLPSKNKFAVYKPVRNTAVDEFVKETRSKYDVSAISMAQSVKKMLSVKNDGESTFLLVADQSPFRPYVRYSLEFFNQETPVHHGFDKLIRKRNFAVIYVNICKPARGKFNFKLEELKPEKENWQDKETIHKFFEALENNIKLDPPNWLWSHKRWKYTKGIHY